MTKQSKTFERVHFFPTAAAARTASYGSVRRRYSGQHLKFVVTEATADVVPAELADPSKFVIQLFDRKTGEPKGVATETCTYGVSFDKPVMDQWRENSTQTIRKDGDRVGFIECEFDMEDVGGVSSHYKRVGTEHYELSFAPGHPLADCTFLFEVERRSVLNRFTGKTSFRAKRAECDPERDIYGVVYPNARKALAAAKRFAKAVL